MADITVTAAQVALPFPDNAETINGIVAETVTAGQSLFRDTNGKYQLADANAAGEQQTRALALEGGVANQSISILLRGYVSGFTLTSQAYDATIYQSDTTGALADAAGTLSVPVGQVASIAQDAATITKVLDFNPRRREDHA